MYIHDCIQHRVLYPNLEKYCSHFYWNGVSAKVRCHLNLRLSLQSQIYVFNLVEPGFLNQAEIIETRRQSNTSCRASLLLNYI